MDKDLTIWDLRNLLNGNPDLMRKYGNLSDDELFERKGSIEYDAVYAEGAEVLW